ncbi:hypothetical protein FOZ62_017673, partial [Perkinsus olseni]
LLFVAAAAKPVGKYFVLFDRGPGILLYIKEDNTVNVMYRCLTDRTFLAGPYRLRHGSGANKYIIDDDSNPGSTLFDQMRKHCPDWVTFDGDLLELSFASDHNSLTTSVGTESVNFQRVDNSFLIPYYSAYLGLEIDVYVSEYEEVEVTVNCGDSRATAILFFKPDERSKFLSQYVLGPEELESYDQFKDELLTACGFELSPNDLKTMTF